MTLKEAEQYAPHLLTVSFIDLVMLWARFTAYCAAKPEDDEAKKELEVIILIKNARTGK